MKTYTENEINAIKFYTGDVSGTDSFYGDGKAYVTLNSLFFPGIATEKMRADEGKRLNPAIIENVPRLLGFFNCLFSAFGKSSLAQSCTAYRVERMTDFEMCRSLGRTISFTSTSLAGFLDEYRDRRGIALMKFNLKEGSHCIDIAEVLDYYAKAEEREILLPPFMEIAIEEKKLTQAESCITDCDGNPPFISAEVSVNGICTEMENEDVHLCDCQSGIRVYNALNNGETPTEADIAEYSVWKKSLQKRLYTIISHYL